MRAVIQDILYEKNKGAINISPNFVDSCLDDYCSPDGCFDFERKPGPGAISFIFDELLSILKAAIPDKYATKEELYKKILISVFCVFNISRSANNPPPVPHIDINELKKLFRSGISTDKEYKKFQELANNALYMISVTFKDKVGNLLLIENQKPDTSDQLTLSNQGKKQSFHENTIAADLWIIANDDDVSSFLENYRMGYMYEDRIRDFIQMIENSNAASAVGILGALDSMSKYNSVYNISCSANVEDPVNYPPLYRAVIPGQTKKSGGRNNNKKKLTRKRR